MKHLSPFHGGLKLDGHKTRSSQAETRTPELPEQLILPLQQHIGEAAEAIVKPGDRVLAGQKVAQASGYVSVPVHASTSGTVSAIEERPVAHPSGLSAPCIVIDVDGRDESIDYSPEGDYESMDPGHLRNIVRDAGIVGLGGAGFPTFIKMNPGLDKDIDFLIINGSECEPYITCDDRLMQDHAEEIIAGAHILRHALKAKHCIIGIESNKPAAIAAMQAAAGNGIEVREVPTLYPMGGEKQLTHVLTGKEVPSDGLPADIGVVMQNVATAAAVYQAVVKGIPLLSRYVTLTGSGIKQPGNLHALIGTPFQHLIDSGGGLTEDTQAIVMGGSMMGFSVTDTCLPVVKTTNCLIAATSEIIGQSVKDIQSMACIRCGACQDVCPVELLPQQLYWYARAKDMSRIQEYNLFDCIECGCCAYVCPSHIPLVSYYRYAKTEIASMERERARADIARRRHEFHDFRIEREKKERAEKRKKKKEALEQNKEQQS